MRGKQYNGWFFADIFMTQASRILWMLEFCSEEVFVSIYCKIEIAVLWGRFFFYSKNSQCFGMWSLDIAVMLNTNILFMSFLPVSQGWRFIYCAVLHINWGNPLKILLFLWKDKNVIEKRNDQRWWKGKCEFYSVSDLMIVLNCKKWCCVSISMIQKQMFSLFDSNSGLYEHVFRVAFLLQIKLTLISFPSQTVLSLIFWTLSNFIQWQDHI